MSNTVTKGIHDVFPEDTDDEEDSISLKNIKNRRHNETWKRRRWVLNLMVSKSQSGWQPRNVTHYCSRYTSGLKVQIRDNNRMALVPSTSNNFSPSLQNFAMRSSPSHRKIDCLALSMESSLLSQSCYYFTEIQNS